MLMSQFPLISFCLKWKYFRHYFIRYYSRHHRSYPDSSGFRMLKWQNNKDLRFSVDYKMMRSTNIKSVKWSLIYVLPSARKNFRKKVFKTSDKNKCILLTSVRNNVVTHIFITQKELILRCPCSQFKRMLRSYQCFFTSYRIYVKQLELYFRFGNHQIQRRLTLSWQSPYHIETSPLIWRGTQVTGFCMTGTSVMKELNKKRI